MTLTTGAILRRITEADLSAASHKLATIILDGIAWKNGYNGFERGTAAFTLAHLAEKMGMSRQHLTALLAKLAESTLALVRWKPNGKFTPWLFRFGGAEEEAMPPDVVSATRIVWAILTHPGTVLRSKGAAACADSSPQNPLQIITHQGSRR